jgi:hypothetical protein
MKFDVYDKLKGRLLTKEESRWLYLSPEGIIYMTIHEMCPMRGKDGMLAKPRKGRKFVRFNKLEVLSGGVAIYSE